MANDKNRKFEPEYCKLLIEHMKLGKSYDSFPSVLYDKFDIYVGVSTMYNWEKDHQDWADAKKIAVGKALNYYETRVMAKTSGQKIDGINPKDIDAYVLMGMLKTRFYKIYGDKVQHDITDDVKNTFKLNYKVDKNESSE
jgi:hypothetical protein